MSSQALKTVSFAVSQEFEKLTPAFPPSQLASSYLTRYGGIMPRPELIKWLDKTLKPIVALCKKGGLSVSEMMVSRSLWENFEVGDPSSSAQSFAF